MQDDKQEVPISDDKQKESLEPQIKNDLESAKNVDVEIKDGKEQEKSHEKEIEQAREDVTSSSQPNDDDNDEKEEKLKALKEADKLRDMEHEGRKIEHLVSLVEKKGVDFAIEVAKKTNDSCLLDLLHDKIIEKGLNKK